MWQAVTRQVRAWEEHPDPTGGRPCEMPPGHHVDVHAPDGATLRGLRAGDPAGDSVMLVHGNMQDRRAWAPVARRLADRGFDVLTIDQRGYGESERGTDPLEGATTLAADLRVWIDHLALEDVTIIAHSMGNVPVLSYCIQHAEEDLALHSLVLVGAFSHVPRMMEPALDSRRALQFTRWLFRRPTLGLLLSRFFFGKRPAGASVRALRGAIAATPADTFAEGGSALGIVDFRSDLHRITVPVDVVVGDADKGTPVGFSVRLHCLLANSRLHVIPDVGHMVAYEAPDTLVGIIERSTQGVGGRLRH